MATSNVNKPLIVVLGATGAQGGSVVDALLKDGKCRVRGCTRDPKSEKAKKLVEKGVEVVRADLNVKSELIAAFKDAIGVFGLTDYYEPSQTNKESLVGKNINEAVKEAGVKKYIFSTLQNCEKVSNGKLKVSHFTDKAMVFENALGMGIPTIGISPAFYYGNFQQFFPPTKENGKVVFSLPIPGDKPIAMFDVCDLGMAVVNAFHNFDKYKGKMIPLVGDNITGEEVAKTYETITGTPAKYSATPLDTFKKSSDQKQHELAQMFQWFAEYGYYGPGADLKIGRELNPNLKSFGQWLIKTGWKI